LIFATSPNARDFLSFGLQTLPIQSCDERYVSFFMKSRTIAARGFLERLMFGVANCSQIANVG
jgi:hypothetical protein